MCVHNGVFVSKCLDIYCAFRALCSIVNISPLTLASGFSASFSLQYETHTEDTKQNSAILVHINVNFHSETKASNMPPYLL